MPCFVKNVGPKSSELVRVCVSSINLIQTSLVHVGFCLPATLNCTATVLSPAQTLGLGLFLVEVAAT